jgi:hypothetical protein
VDHDLYLGQIHALRGGLLDVASLMLLLFVSPLTSDADAIWQCAIQIIDALHGYSSIL